MKMVHSRRTAPAVQSPDVETPGSGLRGRILLVDDDKVGLEMLSSIIEDLGFAVEMAENGAQALEKLKKSDRRFDLVVTDRMMPVVDGLTLTRDLKRDPEFSDMPVVMLTGRTEAADVAAGLEAGAFYYLLKPADASLVALVLESAMREVTRKRDLREDVSVHPSAFRNVDALTMSLSAPAEVEPVCKLLASLNPAPERVVQGIFELVQNAVEHGLYGFGFAAKHRLISEGNWQDALAERSAEPVSGADSVKATILRRGNGLILTVTDPGGGFDWRPYLSSEPVHSSALCGRGIARANSFIFDKLVYNEAGNQATALMQLQKRPHPL
jgi:CheY-like chemotaxis protein